MKKTLIAILGMLTFSIVAFLWLGNGNSIKPLDGCKDNEELKITIGAMNGDLLDIAAIQALAKLPGREELLATLVGTMAAPMTKLVQTLNEVPSKFVRTLAAVRDSRPDEQAA